MRERGGGREEPLEVTVSWLELYTEETREVLSASPADAAPRSAPRLGGGAPAMESLLCSLPLVSSSSMSSRQPAKGAWYLLPFRAPLAKSSCWLLTNSIGATCASSSGRPIFGYSIVSGTKMSSSG